MYLLFTRNSSMLYTYILFPETSMHTNINTDSLSVTSKSTQLPSKPSPLGLSTASTAPDTCTPTAHAYPQLLLPLQPLKRTSTSVWKYCHHSLKAISENRYTFYRAPGAFSATKFIYWIQPPPAPASGLL